jgi:hypothetical protein
VNPVVALGVSGDTFVAVKAAEESCRIVAKLSFSPGHLVDASYIEEYRPVMEQRLTVAGAGLVGLLNSSFNEAAPCRQDMSTHGFKNS